MDSAAERPLPPEYNKKKATTNIVAITEYNVGILRPIDGGEQKFEITNFGTGF